MALFKGKIAGKISVSKKFPDGSKVTVKLVPGLIAVTADAVAESISKNDADVTLRGDMGDGVNLNNSGISGFLDQGKELLEGLRSANSVKELSDM